MTSINISVACVLALHLPSGCNEQSASDPSANPTTSTTEPREWRITEALDPAAVDARVLPPGSSTTISYVEQPGSIRIILPDGETHEAEPFLVQAAQESQRLAYVRLLFPAESLNAAVARAQVMLDEWEVATPEHASKLDKWQEERQRLGYKHNTQSDPLHASFNSPSDLRFPRQVEIRPSFDMDHPWYVAVGVSFHAERERQRARESTSAPATD